MEERYSRNFPALSDEEFKRLRAAKICVIGCGGIGGNLIEQLARVGIGAIRAVDGDVFEPSNLNRQLLSSVSAIGISKAEAAEVRVREINPDVAVEAVNAFLTADNAEALIEGCDAVLDALDNIDARRILARACEKRAVPYVYGAVSGWVAQAAISMPGDQLIQRLYPDGAVIRSKSVLSFAPALCAAMQSALCVRLLIGDEVQTGTIYYFDTRDMEFETITM